MTLTADRRPVPGPVRPRRRPRRRPARPDDASTRSSPSSAAPGCSSSPDRDGLDAARATPLLGERDRSHHPHERGQLSLGAAAAARTGERGPAAPAASTPGSASRRIVHEEICSGLMAREATVFAQALGVAATFRPEHNRAIADAIRLQMRSIGAHQGLSPVLDICRDPRWGRLEETYGEDPLARDPDGRRVRARPAGRRPCATV